VETVGSPTVSVHREHPGQRDLLERCLLSHLACRRGRRKIVVMDQSAADDSVLVVSVVPRRTECPATPTTTRDWLSLRTTASDWRRGRSARHGRRLRRTSEQCWRVACRFERKIGIYWSARGRVLRAGRGGPDRLPGVARASPAYSTTVESRWTSAAATIIALRRRTALAIEERRALVPERHSRGAAAIWTCSGGRCARVHAADTTLNVWCCTSAPRGRSAWTTLSPTDLGWEPARAVRSSGRPRRVVPLERVLRMLVAAARQRPAPPRRTAVAR
jgi:hypothetical protein